MHASPLPVRRWILLGLAALIAAAPAPAVAKKPKKPSRAVVTKLIKETHSGFARSYLPHVNKLKVVVSKPQYGRPHIGDWYQDGTPANVRTWVFPVRIKHSSWIACNDMYASQGVYTGGEYGLFRDEFGDWTYRGVTDSSEIQPLDACPL